MRSSMITKVENSNLNLKFIEGDVVLAKCEQSIPQPAVISFFRGSDQILREECYKVLFVVGKSWAYVHQSSMQFLTFKRIRELRQTMKKRKSFINGLRKGENILIKLGQSLTGKLKDRYNQIYFSEEPLDFAEFNKIQLSKTLTAQFSRHSLNKNMQENNIMAIEISPQESKLKLKALKYNKCKKITYIQLEIRMKTIESMRQISICLNNFLCNYLQQIQIPNVLDQVELRQLSFEQNDAKSNSFEILQNVAMGQQIISKNQPEQQMLFYDRETSAEGNGSIDEGKQGQQINDRIDVDKVLFQNIQNEIRKSFEQLKDYMRVFHKEMNDEISESSKILKGIDLQKIEIKIKQILGHLKNYNLTIHQRKVIFQCLVTFTYYFIEFQTSNFLFKNISKIKQIVANQTQAKESYPLQKVPILGIYQFVNRILREWVDIIDEDYYREKNNNKKVVSSDIRLREILRCAILNQIKIYEDKLKDFKNFILK